MIVKAFSVMLATIVGATWVSPPTWMAEAAVQQVHDEFTFGETDWEKRRFGPPDWSFVGCHDVDSCPGWPTNWENYNDYIPYDGTSNMCKDCSVRKGGNCRHHQQSPINLERNITAKRQCKDRHRMNFEKGNCRFGKMNFEVLPHVLRAYQPDYCETLPWIDFSWGFPDPWMLQFTDIVVPSNHAFEGKIYDAEVVLSHVYSVNQHDRLIGNVAVLLEAGDEDDHYDFLELYIRRWIEELKVVEENCNSTRRMMRGDASAMDEDFDEADDHGTIRSLKKRRLEEPEKPIQYLEKKHYEGEFHPYDWLVEVDTQYYFRYEGSMPEPPCFEGVHWRVMKHPIKVAPSQIHKLEKLVGRRLNPETCEPDTVGKRRESDPTKFDINRPLQTNQNAHKLVYCECEDWRSPLYKDRHYCKLSHEERGVVDVQWPTFSPTVSFGPTFSNEPTVSPQPTIEDFGNNGESDMPSDMPSDLPSQGPSVCKCNEE